MFIVNGRVGSDALIGKATCKNVSVVDYAICTTNVLTCINDFFVNDFDPMLSDVHCAVCLTLCCENTDGNINNQTHPETQLSSLKKEPTKPAWKPNLASDFKYSLNELDISSILSELHSLGNEPRTQGAISNVVDQINSLFRDVAYELNMFPREDKSTKPNKTRARHYPHKAWYNQDCEIKRREYIKFENIYRQLKNVNNLDLLRPAGKVYKKEINKAFRKYKETIVHKVRQLKTSNARENWSIISGKKSNKILRNISLEVLREHFKK